MNLFGRFSGKKKAADDLPAGEKDDPVGLPLIARPPVEKPVADKAIAKPIPSKPVSAKPLARPVPADTPLRPMPQQAVRPTHIQKPVMPARSVTFTPSAAAKIPAPAARPVQAPAARPVQAPAARPVQAPAARPVPAALPAKPAQQPAVKQALAVQPVEESPQDRFLALRGVPGFDMDAYQKMLSRPPPKCIRVNTLKASPQEVKERLTTLGWKLHQVPWYDNAFWVDAESPGSTLEHCLGYYYVQDAGSIAVPLAFKGVYQLSVLDLCAAPGAKTTMLSQMMRNSGVVVANDASSERIRPLAMSVQRMGATNCVVTHTDGRNYPNWGKGKFDCVLVDAPCSGFGQVREVANGAERGPPEKYTKLQKDLILAGYDCLKPGGELVYSTCTFTVEENEEVVQHLLNNRAAVVLDLELGLRHDRGITGMPGLSDDLAKCARIYPWQNATDGFFICKVKKGHIPEAKKEASAASTGHARAASAGPAAKGGLAPAEGPPERERTPEEIMVDDVFEGSLGEDGK